MGDEAKFREAIDALHTMREEHGVDINGKMYSMVKDRVEVFRKEFGSDYGINTTIISDGLGENGTIIIRAEITRIGELYNTVQVAASGHAMTRVDEANDISFNAGIEATETAAIGRALAAFGLHGGEYASDKEMSKAMKRKSAPPPPQGQKKAPPATRPDENFYMPVEYWNDPDKHNAEIVKCVKEIKTTDELSKYWAALDPLRREMKRLDERTYENINYLFSAKNDELMQPQGEK